MIEGGGRNGKRVGMCQGTTGCTPNSVPMVFIAFSRDSWGLSINTRYIGPMAGEFLCVMHWGCLARVAES